MQTVISNRLDWALAYQKAGLQVIPVKHKSLPAIKWQQKVYLKPTEDQLEQWFSRDKIEGCPPMWQAQRQF